MSDDPFDPTDISSLEWNDADNFHEPPLLKPEAVQEEADSFKDVSHIDKESTTARGAARIRELLIEEPAESSKQDDEKENVSKVDEPCAFTLDSAYR